MNRAESLYEKVKIAQVSFGVRRLERRSRLSGCSLMCLVGPMRPMCTMGQMRTYRSDETSELHSVRPQRPQNFVPEGYVTPQPGHNTSTGFGAADHAICAPPSDAPQRPQNFVPGG